MFTKWEMKEEEVLKSIVLNTFHVEKKGSKVNPWYILISSTCDKILYPVRHISNSLWTRPVDRPVLLNNRLELHSTRRTIRRLRKILTKRNLNKFQTIRTIHIHFTPVILFVNIIILVFSLTLTTTDLSYIHTIFRQNNQLPQSLSFLRISSSCTRNYHSAQEIHKHCNAVRVKFEKFRIVFLNHYFKKSLTSKIMADCTRTNKEFKTQSVCYVHREFSVHYSNAFVSLKSVSQFIAENLVVVSQQSFH